MPNSRASLLLLGTSAVALLSTAAWSQEPAGNPQQSETVIVTGSRVARQGFESPTPITAISQADLEAKAATTVTDIMAEIPALAPNRTVNSSSQVGVSNFNLRNIGARRTLVLVDGDRMPETSPGNGFNVNVLPAELIQRVEIVTGGASSAYGSDAITGVVNVTLQSQMTGGKVNFQVTGSNYGDDHQIDASLAYGHSFADGRGQVIFAGSFYTQPKMIYQNDRPWGAQGWQMMKNNPAAIAAGGPQWVIAPGATSVKQTAGGVILSGAAKYTQFGLGGAQSPFHPGNICDPASAGSCQNGDGLRTYSDIPSGNIAPSTKRRNLYTKVTYNLTDSIQVYAGVMYAFDDEEETNIPNYNNGDITISVNNAFLPANIKTLMQANNQTTFLFGRANLEEQTTYNTSTTSFLRFTAGVKGDLPWDGWTWDLHSAYTQDDYSQVNTHNRVTQKWLYALDSIANPAVGGAAGVAVGAPICRITLTNPSEGCVAANPFGIGTVSPSVIAYMDGTSWAHAGTLQFTTSANVRGDLFDTWAGPVSVAFGGEYRRDSTNLFSDPNSAAGAWRQASFAPWYGAEEVREGYVEAVVPLANGIPFLEKLELDTAARIADYDSSGAAFVWKAGVNWTVDDQIRFRATYSRDFRAPDLNDLYSAPLLVNGGSVVDKQPGAHYLEQENVQTLQGGNPALKPETATTFTPGVVVSPSFIPNLTLSVDYYNIRMGNALSTFNVQQVVDNCYAGLAQFCPGITRSATTGQITRVAAVQFNAQVLKVSGVDLEARYMLPLDSIFSDLDGTLTFSELANYAAHIKTISNGAIVENTGFLVGNNALPHWRSSTTVTYASGPLTARVLMYYIGPGLYSNQYYNTSLINIPHYNGRTYFDVSAQYDLSDRIQLYGKIDNLLNQNPPLLADASTALKGVSDSSSLYDMLGRVIGLGVRYNW